MITLWIFPILTLFGFIITATIFNSYYIQTTYYQQTRIPFLALITNIGAWGEYLTYKYLRHYEKQGARFLFNCYLPRENEETTEIDVLMIYKSGIYVFESKNYSGWIFGNDTSKTWTQSLPRGRKSHKEHFLNPIWQNKLHIKTLKEVLGKEDLVTHSIIVFSERCTLKKVNVSRENAVVIKRDQVTACVNQIDHKASVALEENQIVQIYTQLYPFTQVSQGTKEQHIQTIQMHQQQKALICPKCGSALVLRTAKKGANAGKQFYGCTAFPECKYMNNIS